jgi:hypothetical protein
MAMIFIARDDMDGNHFDNLISQLYEDMEETDRDKIDMLELHVSWVAKDYGPTKKV